MQEHPLQLQQEGHQLYGLAARHFMANKAYNRPINNTIQNYMEKCEQAYAKDKTKASMAKTKDPKSQSRISPNPVPRSKNQMLEPACQCQSTR